jgi:cytochrome c553
MIGKTYSICKIYEPDETKLALRNTKGKLTVISQHLTCKEAKKIRGAENKIIYGIKRASDFRLATKKRKAEKLFEQEISGKVCGKCKKKKPIKQFFRTKYATSYCKTCHRASVKKSNAKNREKIAEYQKEYQKNWLENNKEKRRLYCNERYKNKRIEFLKSQQEITD